MNEECHEPEEEREHPLVDALKKFGEDLRKSDVCDHVRGVKREALLVMRGLIDVCISQIDREDKADDEGERGHKVAVE